MRQYIIQQGDCVSSIAEWLGLAVKCIWDHPLNTTLKRRRNSPNVLLPGDVIAVPALRATALKRATERRHCFLRKGLPTDVRLRLVANGRALQNEPYSLSVAGRTVQGRTDDDGRITCRLPARALTALLELKGGKESFTLRLGFLDPVEEISGIQARLAGLGYYSGPTNGERTIGTRDAIKNFQEKMGLVVTGEPDTSTLVSVKAAFGS